MTTEDLVRSLRSISRDIKAAPHTGRAADGTNFPGPDPDGTPSGKDKQVAHAASVILRGGYASADDLAELVYYIADMMEE